jgi:hypothetical protein
VGKVGQMLVAFGLKKQFDDSLLLLPRSNAWKSCRCLHSRTVLAAPFFGMLILMSAHLLLKVSCFICFWDTIGYFS